MMFEKKELLKYVNLIVYKNSLQFFTSLVTDLHEFSQFLNELTTCYRV